MHPPGWYPSPHYPDSMQYWNGNGWTADIQPRKNPAKLKSRTGLRILAGFFLFMGLIPLSLTTPSVVDHLTSGSSKTEATGQVTDIDWNRMKRSDGHKGRVDKCAATAEFTVNGTQHQARSELYVYPCKWEIGDSVKVTYDTRHPESGAIVGDASQGSMFGVWLFFGIGSLLALAGASILGASLLRKVREQPLHQPVL
jgi:hypothetical protein